MDRNVGGRCFRKTSRGRRNGFVAPVSTLFGITESRRNRRFRQSKGSAGFPLLPGLPGRMWPKFWPVVTKFGREATLVKAVFWWNVTFALGVCDGEANSVGGLRRLHCCSPAGWCANSAGDTMSCCRAFEYAEALDLSADRWAKMLVRRQEHDLEIIVALAAASSRGPIDFRKAASGEAPTSGEAPIKILTVKSINLLDAQASATNDSDDFESRWRARAILD